MHRNAGSGADSHRAGAILVPERFDLPRETSLRFKNFSLCGPKSSLRAMLVPDRFDLPRDAKL